MKRLSIKVLALLICITSFGQERLTFENYISNFKSIETGIPNRNDFSSELHKPLSQDFIKQFVTSTPDCECQKEGLYYFYTFKIEEENHIITLVSKICEMALSEELSYYDEKMLLVYSLEGELIDSMTIAREQAYQFYNYGGTWKPFNLQIKHASAMPEDVIRETPPYPCKYDTYQYTISPEGKIEKKAIEKAEQGVVEWKNDKKEMEIVRDSDRQIYKAYLALREKNDTFEKYISSFKLNQTGTIDQDCFHAKEEIPGYFIKRFITNKLDCECLNEALWDRYMSKIEMEDFIIAFVCKSCDTPSSSGNYPYSDVILIVYSKKGEIIDSKVISRGGDLWQCNYSGSTDPFRLIVEQASTPKKEFEKTKAYPLPCEIRTSGFGITKEGRIEQTVVSEGKGTIIWDKTKNKSLIVKGNN